MKFKSWHFFGLLTLVSLICLSWDAVVYGFAVGGFGFLTFLLAVTDWEKE